VRACKSATPECALSLSKGTRSTGSGRKDLLVALWSIRATSIDSSEQLVDHLRRDAFVIKVRAGHIPPSHGTVESDKPRDTVPPKITRP
jgi:hypothetical protein